PYKLYARSQNFSISPSGELNLSNDSYLFVNFTNNTAAAIPINQPNTLILIDSSANYLNDTILNKSIYLWFTYPYQSQKIYQSLINFSITPYYTATINSADTLILQGATNEGSNPTIGEIKLFAGVDTNTQTDTLTPNSKMTLLIPLSDKDKFYDIDTVTIKIFHNSFTSDDNDTDRYKITIYWHASNDSIFFANNNQNWQIDYSNSQTPGMNNQSFDTQYLKIVFIPSKIIKYTNNKDWRILVSASSYYPGEQVFSDTLNVACAFYSELKISPNNNGIFFKNDTGTIFNRLINPSAGAFDINIIANDSFAVILKSTNFVADSEILFVDSNAVFNYNFVNDTTTADSITTYNKLISPILNPTSYNGIDTNLYLWLNYGETNGQTYNGELLIAIVNNDDSGVSSSETIYLSGATIGGLDDPRILEIKLYDSNNNETNTLLPNTNMFIKIRVQEIDNGFDDIDTITFYIYHNSCTYLAQDTPALHSTFRWTANNDSWTLIGPLNSTWQINIDSCYAHAGSGDTASVEISLALRVGSTAKYDTQFNWIIMPVVESRTQSENAASFISVKSAFYCQLNFIDTIGIFPTNNPNTQNNALQTPNSYLRYYVISNGNYDIFYKSDNFTGGGGILVSQNNFTGYHLNNVNLSTPITNSYSAHKQNQTATSETGETQQLYLWLDYNYDTQTTYNGTLYLSIAPQSSANYYAVDTALISAATNAGSQPLISRPILYSDDNGGTTAISNILTPNNEMTLTFEIREFDGIIDIDTVFVYIWDSSAADSETNNTASSAIFMYYIDGAARKVISLTDNWSIDTIYSTAPPVNSISS
ncbi:MAG TPA: hypothetical protein PLM75_09410, partial [bacterium]|nr:hypothetical protein [bacterium]